MNESDKSPKKVNSWVFLSHSNEDYEKVTLLRNMLEEQKKRPIMFYLKCMENPAYRKELEGLLKREIDAREQFILCDSDNARKSDWVQEEVRYIKSKGRKYQTIDIDADPESIRNAVCDFVNRDKVFISYSHSDSSWASALASALEMRGYSAFLDIGESFEKQINNTTQLKNSILRDPGESFGKQIINTIEDSDRRGYQICLLSRAFCRSKWCLTELNHIINNTPSKGHWLLLVMLEEIPHNEWPDSISDRNIPVTLTSESFEFEIEKIVRLFLDMERSHNK